MSLDQFGVFHEVTLPSFEQTLKLHECWIHCMAFIHVCAVEAVLVWCDAAWHAAGSLESAAIPDPHKPDQNHWYGWAALPSTGSSDGETAAAGGWRLRHHSVRHHAPRPKPPNPRHSPELGRLAGKRIMRDDGICHHLHCPGKILFDRATREGLVMSHGQVTRRFLRFVHQSKKPHNQFVTKAARLTAAGRFSSFHNDSRLLCFR